MRIVDNKLKKGTVYMKQPIWVVNLSLLGLLVVVIGFLSLYNIKLPTPQSLAPQQLPVSIQQKIEALDVSKIYQNDLFGTYIAPIKEPEVGEVVPVPQPPAPVLVPPPPVEKPKFLEPLPLTLTGIIMLNDDATSRAIIMDNRSKQETSYKIGDEVEDAQLVKIFSKKILLIRSNGQQEILYLSQDDALAEVPLSERTDWSRIVKRLTAGRYLVDRAEFAQTVGTLSAAIEAFELATAYKDGANIGVKIGQVGQQSLANAMGFMPGDIITQIDALTVRSTKDRVAVYKHITELDDSVSVTINFLRQNRPVTYTYKLGIISPRPSATALAPGQEVQKDSPAAQKIVADEERDNAIDLLKQKEEFAPTEQELRLREKEHIVKYQKALQSEQEMSAED